MQCKITQALVEKTPAPPKGRIALYADTEMRGFYLIASPTKRGFYVQSLVNGRQVRTKIGDHPSMTAKDARAAAARTLVSMKSGVNPSEERRKARARGITLRQALDLHLASKPLSPKTVEGYRYNVERYLPDWLDRTLAELGGDRVAVRERHQRITKRSGKATADATFRVFRAVYGRGLREHPDLPSNPTGNVDFHGVKKRKVDADADRLRKWGRAVLELAPVRRDLHLFMLLTGMRRTASCEAMRADLGGDVLHVPKPKGGTARAFDLPLSRALQDLLAHRDAEADSVKRRTPWLFPSASSTGHVQEVQQEELGGLTGHALRHCFGTLAAQAGVPLLELKYLLNHASGDVTMGYLHPSVDHLRIHQERATAYVLDAIGLRHEPGSWPPTLQDATPGSA